MPAAVVGSLASVDGKGGSLASRLQGVGYRVRAAEKLAQQIVESTGKILSVYPEASSAKLFTLEAGHCTGPLAPLVPVGSVPCRGKTNTYERKRKLGQLRDRKGEAQGRG